jgi:NAD(P)-dependent dehydrogenase (short-subunit alcohol dehydrogenase family)
MRDLAGKTAFITGGASGIGFAMAQAFGREGMNIMLADIETAALASAVAALRDESIVVEGVATDVASRDSVGAAAERTIVHFGKVHLVCNNAGVSSIGRIGEIPARDWDWVIDVNIKGVVHGVETFTPLIGRHGEGGHFVNTSSAAGMASPPLLEPYCATKFAVVGMSEGWAEQLAEKNIGMSILCPALVATRGDDSRRNRTSQYGADPAADTPETRAILGMQQLGIPAEVVGARVLEAVLANELYIFTHPEYKDQLKARFDRILAAVDQARASAALASLPARDTLSFDQAVAAPSYQKEHGR